MRCSAQMNEMLLLQFPTTQSPVAAAVPTLVFSTSTFNNNHQILNPRRNRSIKDWSISAEGGQPEAEYEVDTDKARRALKELDQQLDSLSNKPVSTPKIKATNFSNELKEQAREEAPEISESVLSYTAFILIAFTLFYNIIFLTVIKPSIDVPDDVAVSAADNTSSYYYSEE